MPHLQNEVLNLLKKVPHLLEKVLWGSKSFRFLQILSAANKQYAGARAPDRQQNQLLPLVFRLYSASLLSLHSQRLLLILISQHFAAILVLFIGRTG